jgi:type I restriction enzyme S subunit
MSDWKPCTLDDICEIYDGPHATPIKQNSGPYFLSISSLQGGQLDLSESAFLSEEDYALWTKRVTPRHMDIVFSYETRLGQAGMIPDSLRCCLGRRMGLLRIKDTNIANPSFLLHYYLGEPFQRVIKDNTVFGTTVDRIPLQKMGEFPITLPPLPEQKKIAEILSGIDREIESLSKAIDLHRKTRNALIESIFEDGHKKAENGSSEWQVWSIEDLLASTATPMRSGPFGSALLKEELAKEGIPFLGIDNVRTEEFVLNFKRFLTDEKFKELRRYEVFPQDVMITIMGTVGRSCVVPEGIGPCVSSKHTWTMTFDHSKVAPEIVCWHLNHYGRTRTKFLESSQGGVMDAISSQTLREIEVPIPTSRVFAEQIVGHYKSSHKHEQTLNKKFRKMKSLKNAVASDLLSGRKRVSI